MVNSIIVDALREKKASNIVIMDFSKLENMLFSYFIVCHGTSTTQVQAISEHVSKTVRKELQTHPLHIEGTSNLQWVLIDYGETIVHIFLEDIRKIYKLEDLWGDTTITNIE
jgi:ribosome-associated protein